MNTDTMTIEVLADGTLKITTDKISAPNHANAQQFLIETSKIAGGTVKQFAKQKTIQVFQTQTRKATA